MARRLADIRPSIRHLFLIVPVAALAWAGTTPFSDNSFLWHVRAGTLQLDQGRVLTEDPFTMEFAGQPWRTQSWLADLTYGSLERIFDGIGWTPYYLFFLVASTITMVLLVTRHRTGNLGVTAGAAVLLCWQAVPFAIARPAIFSYLMLAAVAASLYRREALWAIPGLIWLWAALHGSFVVGIGVVILEGIRLRSRRHFEVAAAAAVLATFTAHGLGVWQILISFAGNRDALSMIQEWQPPDYSHPFMVPFALMVAGVIFTATRGKLETRSLIVVVPFLLFGMLAVRNLYPAMIVVLPYAAAGFVPEKASVPRRDPAPLVFGLAAVVVLFGFVGLVRPVRFAEDAFPPPAALDALQPGPIFHGIGPGGYLIYAQWPERPILVDDRAELFGREGFERYIDVSDGYGWQELFAELDIRQALMEPDWILVRELSEAGWVEVYRDDNFVIAADPASRSG